MGTGIWKRNKIGMSVLVFVVVLLLVLLTKGFWSASPGDLNGAPPPSTGDVAVTQVQLADYEAPSDGFIADGKCYRVTVGGLTYEVSCSTFHKLPPKVRQCVGSVASSMGIGFAYALEHMMAAFLAGVSGACVPW